MRIVCVCKTYSCYIAPSGEGSYHWFFLKLLDTGNAWIALGCDAQSELAATHFWHDSTCQPLNERHFCAVSERYRVLVSTTESARAFAWFSSFSVSSGVMLWNKRMSLPHPVHFVIFIRPMFSATHTWILSTSLNKPQIKRRTAHRACAFCPTLHVTLSI